MALTRSWQNIGGAKHEMRKKNPLDQLGETMLT